MSKQIPVVVDIYLSTLHCRYLAVYTWLTSYSCIITMEAIAIVIVSYTIMGTVHKPCLRPGTQQVIQENWTSTSAKVGIVVSHSTWKVQCIIAS